MENLLNEIHQAIADESLVLPTLPDVAMRVREAVASDDVTAKKLSDIVAQDPAMTARLLQVANSPLYRGAVPFENLQSAIMRMGFGTVQSLVTSLAMQQLFQPRKQMLAQMMREIWEQSVSVAAMARALVAFAPRLNPELAMLAGLIHQIGALPLLMYAEERTDSLEEEPFRELVRELHPLVGGLIARAWELPEPVQPVPMHYVDFTRQIDGEADYVDLVQVAFLQNGGEAGVPLSEVTAYGRLGLNADTEELEAEEVRETAEQARQALA
ncbi:MAG: HDOD domain-containing protein [Gammaproteobacteria bacterium]|nr:MAG: HDOD domain-containing protein [Gammaproteobacteria bacterium]